MPRLSRNETKHGFEQVPLLDAPPLMHLHHEGHRQPSRSVSAPDPEIRPLIEEARGVLASAERMAESTRH